MTSVLERPPPRADRRLAYGDAPAQLGDLWLPERGEGWPLVVALHGGYWRAENDLAHLGHLCLALRDAGIAVLSLEYRRLGMPGGDLHGMLADVKAGLALARRLSDSFPIRPGPPALLGHSAGAHLALCAAKGEDVRGVVALAAISDLRLAVTLGLDGGIAGTLLASAGDAGYPGASPIERVPLGVRQVLVHGDADRGVPVSMSVAYAARAEAAGDRVCLRVLPGVGHLELIDPASVAFLDVLGAVREIVQGEPGT